MTDDTGQCFSRPGWWQTLCGLDAANQGFGWTSTPSEVTCRGCQLAVTRGDHKTRRVGQYLTSMHTPRV